MRRSAETLPQPESAPANSARRFGSKVRQRSRSPSLGELTRSLRVPLSALRPHVLSRFSGAVRRTPIERSGADLVDLRPEARQFAGQRQLPHNAGCRTARSEGASAEARAPASPSVECTPAPTWNETGRSNQSRFVATRLQDTPADPVRPEARRFRGSVSRSDGVPERRAGDDRYVTAERRPSPFISPRCRTQRAASTSAKAARKASFSSGVPRVTRRQSSRPGHEEQLRTSTDRSTSACQTSAPAR